MKHIINERTALVMLEGTIPQSAEPDPHFTRRYNRCMESFAETSLGLYKQGKISKFKEYLNLSSRLLREGNDAVRNGVINIYYFALTLALSKDTGREVVETVLSTEVKMATPSKYFNDVNQDLKGC